MKKGGIMANEQNLIPLKSLSTEEAKKRGSLGGKKSVEARRKKKTAREMAIMFASLPSNGKIKDELALLGIEENENVNQMAMIVGLAKKAMTGEPNSVKLYLELMGEVPVAKLNLGGNIQFNSGGLKETLEELKKRE